MTFTYREQLEMLQGISLNEGESRTLDCPFCHARRKFSISCIDGKLLWNCYRASCSAKGSYQGKRSADVLKRKLTSPEPLQPVRKTPPLPAITGSIWNHAGVLEYLSDNNCMDAVQRGAVRVRYAPSEDRVLFVTQNREGAVGRSLRPSKAKWWTYGDVSEGYQIGLGNTAILVEDVPSACSVSRIPDCVGIPLLGTNISMIPSLAAYSSVIIILDKDAASKSISLARQIGPHATVRLTEDDPKKLDLQQLRDLLHKR